VVVALASAVLVPTQRWLSRHYGIQPEREAPSPVRRTIAAFTVLLRMTAMPLMVLWAAYGVLLGNGWLSGLVGSMALIMMQAVSVAFLAYGLAQATLA